MQMQNLVREAHVLPASSALPNCLRSGIDAIYLENPNRTISKENNGHADISTELANGETALSKQGAAKEEQNADSTSQNGV